MLAMQKVQRGSFGGCCEEGRSSLSGSAKGFKAGGDPIRGDMDDASDRDSGYNGMAVTATDRGPLASATYYRTD